MKDTTQIALFFEEGTEYNPASLSSKISEKIKEIGYPILLPMNPNIPKEANAPIIIFDQNPDLKIQANYNNIVITCFNNYINKIVDIVDIIYDIFNENKIKFYRIGYVPTKLLDIEEKEKISKKFMNDVATNDYQFSWLRTLEFKEIEINCWERNITNSIEYEGLIKSFDFNTKPDDQIKINKEFISDFVEFCDEYMNK